MLIICTNSICLKEKKYIFKQIFNVFLGLEYILRIDESAVNIEIAFDSKKIVIENYFFEQFKMKTWLSHESMPKLPLKKIKIKHFDYENEIPILFGNETFNLSYNE